MGSLDLLIPGEDMDYIFFTFFNEIHFYFSSFEDIFIVIHGNPFVQFDY